MQLLISRDDATHLLPYAAPNLPTNYPSDLLLYILRYDLLRNKLSFGDEKTHTFY